MSDPSALIGALLKEATHIVVVSHIRPDGDAVGSLLGLGLALQAAGKDVQMVLADGLPANFRFLPGAEQVKTKAKPPVDLSVVVDCSDLGRVGKALVGLYPESTPGLPDVNIDHHITNLDFARVNLVETTSVATTAVLARHLPKWGLQISPQVAAALMTGLLTDTIGFRTSNMNPEALRIAAELVEAGAHLPDLYHEALLKRTYSAAQLWGRGLVKLQREGEIIWTVLTMADRKETGYTGLDDADLINVLSTVNGAEIALIFSEQPHGTVKVSWRALPPHDVSQIALAYGGGGHMAASGADITGETDEIVAQVLKATHQLLARASSAA